MRVMRLSSSCESSPMAVMPAMRAPPLSVCSGRRSAAACELSCGESFHEASAACDASSSSTASSLKIEAISGSKSGGRRCCWQCWQCWRRDRRNRRCHGFRLGGRLGRRRRRLNRLGRGVGRRERRLPDPLRLRLRLRRGGRRLFEQRFGHVLDHRHLQADAAALYDIGGLADAAIEIQLRTRDACAQRVVHYEKNPVPSSR